MRSVILGLLLGLLLAYPHLLLPLVPLARTAVGQPLLWAFAAGVIARPRIARRLVRRAP
jgi:hypothetical protein